MGKAQVKAKAKPMLSKTHTPTGLPGDHRDVEPPDPIPNSEVKRVIADGSVAFAM